jgi:hypothetical protein
MGAKMGCSRAAGAEKGFTTVGYKDLSLVRAVHSQGSPHLLFDFFKAGPSLPIQNCQFIRLLLKGMRGPIVSAIILLVVAMTLPACAYKEQS